MGRKTRHLQLARDVKRDGERGDGKTVRAESAQENIKGDVVRHTLSLQGSQLSPCRGVELFDEGQKIGTRIQHQQSGIV